MSPGLLVPERFLIPSSCPSSSDVSNALREVCVSGLGEAPSAALWSPPSPSSPLIPTRAQIPRQWPGLRPSPFVRGAELSRSPGKNLSQRTVGSWEWGGHCWEPPLQVDLLLALAPVPTLGIHSAQWDSFQAAGHSAHPAEA